MKISELLRTEEKSTTPSFLSPRFRLEHHGPNEKQEHIFPASSSKAPGQASSISTSTFETAPQAQHIHGFRDAYINRVDKPRYTNPANGSDSSEFSGDYNPVDPGSIYHPYSQDAFLAGPSNLKFLHSHPVPRHMAPDNIRVFHSHGNYASVNDESTIEHMLPTKSHL